MRRSLGGGNGGGGGGGSMLRTVQKAVRAGRGAGGATHEPFSHATNTNNTRTNLQTCNTKSITTSSNRLNSSSQFSSHNNNPISSATWPTESEWIWESEDERRYSSFDDNLVFGTVPSTDEVQHAVFALQNVLEPTSYSSIENKPAFDTNEPDWIEPLVDLYNSKVLKPLGENRVYDAFHLLNTEPSVQKMVVSLSSDTAIWNAVLNNEAVREFRESLIQGPVEENMSECPDDDSDESIKDVLRKIFVEMKAKAVKLFDKIMKVVNEVFQPLEKIENGDPLEQKLSASFLLSVLVLLIVVVTRANLV